MKLAEETLVRRRRGKRATRRLHSQPLRQKDRSADSTLESQWVAPKEQAGKYYPAKSLRSIRTENGRQALPFIFHGKRRKAVLFEVIKRIRIISNNPLVALCAGDCFVPVESVLPVLNQVRDLVHQGHHLLTHPLAGSLKPNENPYRSVVVTNEVLNVDCQSVRLVEGAIEVASRMLAERPYRAWSGAVRADLQLVDKALLASALDALGKA